MMEVTQRIDEAIELFHTLSHPIRLRLLVELCCEEECVCHLAALLNRPQPYISQQLAELRQAGLVADRRDGQRVFYHIVDRRVELLLLAMGLVMVKQHHQANGCVCPKCA